MGDYSSTFKIQNMLDSDLSAHYPDPNNGYWLRGTTSSVAANSWTSDIQLKDRFGFTGTDGQVHLRGMLRGREFVIYIHVKCGRTESNFASIESPDKRLDLSVQGFSDLHNNPMTGVEFIIQERV